jgi:hypothetical protein
VGAQSNANAPAGTVASGNYACRMSATFIPMSTPSSSRWSLRKKNEMLDLICIAIFAFAFMGLGIIIGSSL